MISKETMKIISANYFIMPSGVIWSHYYKREVTSRTRNDCLAVTLKVAHKTYKQIYVHRLVASKYVPNPDNKSCVTFIDDDKTNTNFYNLKWVHRRELTRMAVDRGRITGRPKGKK